MTMTMIVIVIIVVVIVNVFGYPILLEQEVPGPFRIPSQNVVKKNPSKMFLALGQSEIGAVPGRVPSVAPKKRLNLDFDFG